MRKQYFYPDKGYKNDAHVLEFDDYFIEGESRVTLPLSYIEFFDRLRSSCKGLAYLAYALGGEQRAHICARARIWKEHIALSHIASR